MAQNWPGKRWPLLSAASSSCSTSRVRCTAWLRPITHAVKFYERGDRPLEIVTSRQWWISTLAHREALLALGRQLHWYPSFMRARYEDWVAGLTSDWLVSRQRFFGIPFPIWYRLGARRRTRLLRPHRPGGGRTSGRPDNGRPPGLLA